MGVWSKDVANRETRAMHDQGFRRGMGAFSAQHEVPSNPEKRSRVEYTERKGDRFRDAREM